MRIRLLLAIALELGMFPCDAHAWGLQTHVYFAQSLLLALPLLDPQLRRAALRFPRLLLAGACLPDLALAGPALGTTAFRRNHWWPTLRRLGNSAACDEDRAISLGYASHLMADIVAHNWFVPEHERRILDMPYVAHAISEWAMDEYLKAHALSEPAEVMVAERACLAAYVARVARCEERIAVRAIDLLAGADRALRVSGLPRLCRRISRYFDRALAPRFETYVRETSLRLHDVGRLLEGAEPSLDAEYHVNGPDFRYWGNGRLALPARLV